ncbi:MAG: hypothetical protein A3E38_03295 [Candidatus Moranbacteria bacterium RIFCSPHIGHO2_12_FULL_54_9]|nr:MAG: hypothetical protein A2878_02675 [Candidatus Moranbacteria bacterium RIFCSPHIGHO2_01_FULL_54_31]OGI24669.1 MAG: hypothetical protein A3E38_03295 [Candidatus Moranbacteria bacterium RIFCSPHIGHO2_12_FULL_54_9]
MPFIFAIIFGALAGSFALILELVTLPGDALITGPSQYFAFGSIFTLLGVALIEETSAYLFLRQYALRYFPGTLASVRATLLSGLLFGIGFASLEIALILWNSSGWLVWPLFGILFIHIVTSLIFALFLLYFSQKRPWFAPAPIAGALVLHTLYNAIIAFF